jgi:hypothetical protein
LRAQPWAVEASTTIELDTAPDEDDLDNRFITEIIVPQMRVEKQKCGF